ncbi:MAG: 50S ribosomal protein L19 [Planctomycetes bacterium]|nr:50S ribosomal protein L19 [Planctomycetota bacterium]
MNLIDEIEKPFIKDELPQFAIGDSVDVHYLIREGDKERIQIFSGTVIAVQGSGTRKMVIVRRIVQGGGVERTFPLHSPRVKDIQVTRRGKVRRAKLYYLRDRVGKATKVKEKIVVGEKKKKRATRGKKAKQAATVEASS